jgi:hypothetical protein
VPGKFFGVGQGFPKNAIASHQKEDLVETVDLGRSRDRAAGEYDPISNLPDQHPFGVDPNRTQHFESILTQQ